MRLLAIYALDIILDCAIVATLLLPYLVAIFRVQLKACKRRGKGRRHLFQVVLLRLGDTQRDHVHYQREASPVIGIKSVQTVELSIRQRHTCGRIC